MSSKDTTPANAPAADKVPDKKEADKVPDKKEADKVPDKKEAEEQAQPSDEEETSSDSTSVPLYVPCTCKKFHADQAFGVCQDLVTVNETLCSHCQQYCTGNS